MDLKNFFNILLLAISLTTILVTLVSYIVFKLRLGSSRKDIYKDPLEGAFYRRFAPLVKSEYIKKKEERKIKNTSKITVKMKFVSLFVFLLLVISGLLLFEDYFSYRKEMSERILAADSFRELVKKGYLKSYEYTPRVNKVDLKERISKNTYDQLSYLSNELKDQKFCLVSTNRANKFSQVKHLQALAKWTSFFKRNKLSYKIINSVTASNKCLMIYPHVHSFSRKQNSEVKSQINPFLVTGGFGVLDGLGAKLDSSLLEELLGENVYSESIAQPTLISSAGYYLWEIEGGSFLSWLPLDTEFVHTLSDSPSLVSSDYNGRVSRVNGKALSRLSRKGSMTWSSLDPIDHPYSDITFLTIFADMTDIPNFKINTYAKSDVSAVFVYKQTNESDGLEGIYDLYKELGMDWTLFTNNFNYRGVEISNREDDHPEVAILTSFEHHFDKHDNRTSFNLVESIKLRLEELSYSGVVGISTYNNFFNEVLLDSINQNKLSYIYGVSEQISYSPIFLSKLNYLLIPKMFRNSEELLDDKSITSIEDMTRVLKSRLADSTLLGGLSIFDISTAEMDDYMYKNSITNLIEEVRGKTTSLGELVSWRIKKENIRLSAKRVGANLKIIVENTNINSVSNFRITFVGAKGKKELLVDKIEGNSKLIIDPKAYLER